MAHNDRNDKWCVHAEKKILESGKETAYGMLRRSIKRQMEKKEDMEIVPCLFYLTGNFVPGIFSAVMHLEKGGMRICL